MQPCPAWSGWGSWGDCSQTCGGGTFRRQRICMNGNVGDPGCIGSIFDEGRCNEQVN